MSSGDFRAWKADRIVDRVLGAEGRQETRSETAQRKLKFQSMTDDGSILDNACSPGPKGFVIPAWWWLASDVVSTQLTCIPVATGNGRGKLCSYCCCHE